MSECGLFWVGETLFWVGGCTWGCIEHYFGKEEGSGSKWGIIFGGWGWVGHYFGWVGMSGGRWG